MEDHNCSSKRYIALFWEIQYGKITVFLGIPQVSTCRKTHQHPQWSWTDPVKRQQHNSTNNVRLKVRQTWCSWCRGEPSKVSMDFDSFICKIVYKIQCAPMCLASSTIFIFSFIQFCHSFFGPHGHSCQYWMGMPCILATKGQRVSHKKHNKTSFTESMRLQMIVTQSSWKQW